METKWSEAEFGEAAAAMLEAVSLAMKSFNSSLTNLQQYSTIACRNPVYVEYRERLCTEMVTYGTDIYPETIKLVEEFGEMISEECLSIETAEQFLNCLQTLIKKCDESKARFEALRGKHTEALSRLDNLEIDIMKTAEKFEKESIVAKASAETKQYWSLWWGTVGIGAFVLSGGTVPVLITGTTLLTIAVKLSDDADTLGREGAELALTTGQMKGMAEGAKSLSNVVEKIWEFHARMANHSKQMARTGRQTKSLKKAETTLKRFQTTAQHAIDACDEFTEAKSANERLLLSITYHYTEEAKEDKMRERMRLLAL